MPSSSNTTPQSPQSTQQYESILAQAEQIIQKRFLTPYQEKLNQLLGDRGGALNHHSSNNSSSSGISIPNSTSTTVSAGTLPPLQLTVNWTSIRELITCHGLAVAENAIQMLQEPSLYENMRKGVMRFISEDKLQRTIFNDQVDVICIDFFAGEPKTDETEATQGEETMVGLSDEQEGHLLYMINASTQEILGSNAFYEQIDESFEELLETHHQILEQEEKSSKKALNSQSMFNMKSHVTTTTSTTPTSTNNELSATKSSSALSHTSSQLTRGSSVVLSSSPTSQQRSALSRQTFMTSPSASPMSPGGNEMSNAGSSGGGVITKPKPLRRMSYIYDEKHLDDDDLIGASSSMTNMNRDVMSNDSDLDKIEQLRRVCLHPHIWEKRDISKMLRMLQNEDLRYWKPNSEQAIMIEKCVEQLELRFKKFSTPEKIIKAWMITKINRKSLKQERVFVLTDSKFYTMKFSKDIDEKHIKMYPLHAVAMMDCARFMPNKDKKKKPYGLAIYMDEEKVSSGSKVAADDDEQGGSHSHHTTNGVNGGDSDGSALTMEDKKKKKNLSQKVLGKLRKEKTLQTNDTFLDDDSDNSSDSLRRGTIVEEVSIEEKSQTRPETNNLVAQYFMSCSTVHQSEDQRDFLMEIAWTLFAACSALKGERQLVPFTQQQIKRPKKDLVGTYLYNKLNIGMKK
ncbi:hypothetical protein C9374_005008 [Naegleria lovaniensis]|uniref:Uncharacterized protein n=1 Tax=Naegleria lovaniensis TaxID=51637 RepID=A0AA88GL90_NAELO|nr:uncharacterized protein C9374_005008 [Naegleria lovaniensis]KAG2383041.1 hypothetical protein C9374_005008 [Naegleria lovaniensis]